MGRATGVDKLNGRVYTPAPLARRVVAALQAPTGRWLDPACGDGVFLEAVLDVAAPRLPAGPEREAFVAALEGWDVDPEALALARTRLDAACARLGVAARPRLTQRDGLVGDDGPFDTIVGNPPYLEAKRMPAALKAHVRAACPVAARGAFDLYGAFVERAWGLLGPGGRLALVIPNRFLVASYAAGVRQLLLDEGAVTVVDLSDADVFDDAAVYPIVLEARRGPPPGYAVRHGDEEAAWPVGIVRDHLSVWPLPPADPVLADWLARTLASAWPRLGDVVHPRWTVSFHKAGLRDRFVFDAEPADAAVPRRFLGGGRYQGNREVAPGRITWSGSWIDHDEARARAEGNPLPALAHFAPPQVVLCQNARRARAALDTEGFVLKDTFLSLRLRDPDDARDAWLPWIVLVVHTRLFHVLYEALYGGTRKGGRYLAFLPRMVAPVPLPPPPDAEAVRALHAAIAAGEAAPDAGEAMVRAAFGVTDAEAAAIDAIDVPDF